jgi:hypothetical protein
MVDLTTTVKSWWDRLLDLSLAARLGVGFVLAALGSSTVLGFLSEYAAYSYSLSVGARLPVEGVPYLNVAVTLISFALLTAVVGGFLLQLLVLRSLVGLAIAHLPRKVPSESLSSLPLKRFLLVATPAAVLSTQPLMLLMYFSLGPMEGTAQWIIPATVFTTAALVTLLLKFPLWIKWFILVGCLLSAMTILVVLFTPNAYAALLKTIRFGGGVPVTLEFDCPHSQTGCTLGAPLMLRTRDYFVLEDSNGIGYVEIPVSLVRRVSYSGTPRGLLQ